jgi:hypothetical protein
MVNSHTRVIILRIGQSAGHLLSPNQIKTKEKIGYEEFSETERVLVSDDKTNHF